MWTKLSNRQLEGSQGQLQHRLRQLDDDSPWKSEEK